MTPQARLEGLRYEGEQPGKDFGHLTDPVTGSTFALHKGETVGKALARLQANYREEPGEDPIQELVAALAACLGIQHRISGCSDPNCRSCRDTKELFKWIGKLVSRYCAL